MTALIRSAALLLVLLNPFLLIIYLIDVVQKLDSKKFAYVLVRAGFIATAVFWLFAVVGDAIFSEVIHTKFASFQIFGGVVFLIIGKRHDPFPACATVLAAVLVSVMIMQGIRTWAGNF